MITFIHTADIHFGMENYGKIDSETGIHTRLLDFKRALDACIDTAIAREVDFFLFSGDAYKTAAPSPTQQRLLLRCFLRLYQAKIPVIIVVGNHDNPLSFGKATSLDLFGELPIDGFHVIAKPTSLRLSTKNGPIQVVGIPWPSRTTITISKNHLLKSAQEITEYISQAVARIIREYAADLDPTIPAVLAGHLTVSSGIFSGSEKRAIYGTDPLFLPSQLAIQPFDYVGLGHLHRYQNLNEGGYPAVVYSGSIERIDFGERKEDKGFCLVTIKEKNVTEHEFIRINARPFMQIELNINAHQPQTEQILAELAKHDIADAVIKILYHLPSGVTDKVSIQTIQKACEHTMYLVSIVPVREFEIRERRSGMCVNQSPLALLDSFFESHTEYKERKDTLLDKTRLLMEEIATACHDEEQG